jgi:Flp pilus assembly protein TadG
MMKQRGQSTVEVVLLAPLLMVLVFLIFEFGRVFGSWLVITNAAREGARFGVTQTFTSSDQCPPTSTCTSFDYAIQTRVANTAQFLSIQNAGTSNAVCQNNNTPPSGSTSCIAISRATDATSGDDKLTVLVVYKVQTLMPISGNIPYLGKINYPGSFSIIGLSTMRTAQ